MKSSKNPNCSTKKKYVLIVNTNNYYPTVFHISSLLHIIYLFLFVFFFSGIPSNQLHLLHNQMELNDSMLLKDIPNFHEGNKLKLKLVLGMKVGPISSARRVPLTDYDSWFDDVMHQNSK